MHLKQHNQVLTLLLSTTAIACLSLSAQAQTLPGDASTMPTTPSTPSDVNNVPRTPPSPSADDANTMPRTPPSTPPDDVNNVPRTTPIPSDDANTVPTTPMVPATTPMAPTTTPIESPPATELPPARTPDVPMQPSTIPTLPNNSPPSNSAPYSAPRAAESGSNSTVPTASTMVFPQETITGIKTVSLPTPSPVGPAYFTLPIQVEVMKDSSITSNNPISDKNTTDIQAWASAVQGCLQQKPMLIRVVGDKTVPFMINGSEGTIKINANDRAVCAA
jgi:hypothetical protein